MIPSGHRLQRLCSNRGGEYTELEHREYCLQTEVKQEFAATNTPQQNGISEREWASLWNMTRCFLAEAGVPNYLAGGLPHGSLPSKSCPVHPAGRKPPFSMWHGGTPSRLEHLRTFGARSFVHEERYAKKIYVKARERRRVGYGLSLIHI